MNLVLPRKVEYIINELTAHGHEAYAVGGCVRDCLLFRQPLDWDITTSCDPLQVKQIFRRTVDTGIKHGTVTVLLENDAFEVTTYRLDGKYEDSRHPREVEFTKSLEEDLKRRDFTINAMAYHPDKGLVDLFGGRNDLKMGLIRCVGSASERFSEDCLRILRAERFAAQLGFSITEDTKSAITENCNNLHCISAERVREELNKILLSPHPEQLMACFTDGITDVVFPEFSNYCRISGEAAVRELLLGLSLLPACDKVQTSLILRWAYLLNAVFLSDESGSIVLPEQRQRHARMVLQKLKFDNETRDTVGKLTYFSTDPVACSSCGAADATGVRKAMNRMGEDIFALLLILWKSHGMPAEVQPDDSVVARIEQLCQEITSKPYCVSLKELAVSGKDLIQLGYQPGAALGELLVNLLQIVLEHPECNTREELLAMAEQKKEMLLRNEV